MHDCSSTVLLNNSGRFLLTNRSLQRPTLRKPSLPRRVYARVFDRFHVSILKKLTGEGGCKLYKGLKMSLGRRGFLSCGHSNDLFVLL